MKETNFSQAQIRKLKHDLDQIEHVDPCGKTFKKLQALVKKFPIKLLKQCVDEDIKWLRGLAHNRLKALEPCLVPACGGTETPVTANGGKKYLYCWDRNKTGIFPGDHVYVDLSTDLPLSQDEHDSIFGNSR